MPTRRESVYRLQLVVADQLTVDLVGFLSVPSGWKGQMHTHPFWELVFFKRGRGLHLYGDEELRVAPGLFYLFAPQMAHQLINPGREPIEMLYIGFSFEFSCGQTPGIAHRAELPGFQARRAVAAKLRQIARVIPRGASSEKGVQILSAMRVDLMGVLAPIVRHLTGRTASAPLSPATRNSLLVDRIKKHILGHLAARVSVKELGQTFYYSPSYLSELFKVQTGLSLKQYQGTLRMQQAMQLLRDPALTVSEVAARVGFQTIHSFTKRFRQQFRLSPSRFRARAGA